METRKHRQVRIYPQFTFRVPDHRKIQFTRIRANIERLHQLLKKRRSNDEITIKRNEIIIEALDRGLADILEEEGLKR